MKALILGCGRVGLMLATILAENKWEVCIVDNDANVFAGLGDRFAGQQVSGSITDEDVLRSAGMGSADLVAVLTADDLANLLAAQIARQKFSREKVLVRVRDPIKAGIYREMGLQTICATQVELDMILRDIGLKPKQ